MPTSYTSLLGLALPVQGELTGTWGDTVNDYITKYVDASVAGTQTISGSQTAVTLSTTTGTTLSQAGSGATGSAQYMVINCTGNPAGLLTVTAPATSKMYVIINGTSTAQSVKIVGPGPTTGVTVLSGDKALVAWNGTDFVRVGASAGGSNTQVQYNSSGNLAGSANFTFDGSNVQIGAQGDLRLADSDSSNYIALQSPAVVSSNVTFTLPSTDGTANQVLKTDGAGALGWETPASLNTPLAVVGNATAGAEIRLPEDTDNGSNYVALKAADTIASNVTFTLPSADGTSGQVLQTNGSGVLSFVTPSSGVSKGQSIAFAMIFGL